ncbi:MAG: Fe-S protein assembly co-chaperone HscB [Planctomycetota bacterium]|jgi:molecular chaperone HscB
MADERPRCEACGQPLDCPLVCEACGALAEPSGTPDPFAIFGIEPRFEQDGETLRKRLLKLSRRLHPDFFGEDAEQRALAERNSAALNDAYAQLSNDFARASLLVATRGGPDSNTERQMPQAFLMEVMEWNETLEEAREAGSAGPEIDTLANELASARAEAMDRAGSVLDLGQDPSEARRQLNAVRYVDRALEQIEELRLGER